MAEALGTRFCSHMVIINDQFIKHVRCVLVVVWKIEEQDGGCLLGKMAKLTQFIEAAGWELSKARKKCINCLLLGSLSGGKSG